MKPFAISSQPKKRSKVCLDGVNVINEDPVMYQCKKCLKTFKSKGHVRYHDACFTGQKPLSCDLCDARFISRGHLEYHIRSHTGDLPFVCIFCKKGFKQSTKLNQHLNTHTGLKSFTCNICEKKFVSQQTLKYHSVVHTGERAYSCNVCKKTFGTPSSLKKHSAIHMDQRHHLCNVCGRAFRVKWSLDVHMRVVHADDRPHGCPVCSQRFANLKDMKRHLANHSDERPFSCIICSAAFKRKDNLRRHFSKTHQLSEEEVKLRLACYTSSNFVEYIPQQEETDLLDICDIQIVSVVGNYNSDEDNQKDDEVLVSPVKFTSITDVQTMSIGVKEILKSKILVKNNETQKDDKVLATPKKSTSATDVQTMSIGVKEILKSKILVKNNETIEYMTASTSRNLETLESTVDKLTAGLPFIDDSSYEEPILSSDLSRSVNSVDMSLHCEYCNESFETMEMLNRHRIDELEHICEICGERFALEFSLQIHQRSHEAAIIDAPQEVDVVNDEMLVNAIERDLSPKKMFLRRFSDTR